MPRARKFVVTVLALAAVAGGGLYLAKDKDLGLPLPGLSSDSPSRSASAPFTPGDPTTSPFTGIADILEKVTPAVVTIQVRAQDEEQADAPPILQDPRFRRFFGVPDRPQQPEQPQRREHSGAGSGVIVDAKEGYVITNFHVVDKATDISVTLKDRRTFTAKVIGKDQATDIALLKIDAPDLMALPIGDVANMRVGDYVLAVGNPFALGQTVTAGIVSALGRSGFIDQGYEDFIQTDAAINPGNSGGALVNLKGELVGIPTVIIGPGGNIGIGFAVPTSIVTNVMNQLIQFGEVSRGRIGVAIQDVTPELAQNLGLSINSGALVSRVEPKSPADDAGIKAGDVVVALNGADVEGSSNLRTRVGLMTPGAKAKLSIMRDGEAREIEVTVAKLDPAQAAAAATPAPEPAAPSRILGAVFGNANGGVVVQDIEENSPAAAMGLEVGDLVTGVNRTQIRSVSELESALKNVKSQSVLRVKRDDRDVVLIVP